MGNICWVASYPKSGNTWIRAFVENYLQNPARPVDINELFKLSCAESEAERYRALLPAGQSLADMTVEEICALRPLVHAAIARESASTRFVKTHNFLGEFAGVPLHQPGVTSGAIYVVRNPLDVVVSMASYFAYSLDEAIDYLGEEMTGTPNEAFHVPQIISSWSNHVHSWTARGEASVLVLRYEDMLANPQKAFRKVESFLGVKRDPARLRKAIQFSSFRLLQQQEAKRGFVEKHENANAFFRQGASAQWKKMLSDEQLKKIVDQHHEQMARFKYLPPGFG